jgi:dihydrofolate synthase / folylpolyglutamate synthase
VTLARQLERLYGLSGRGIELGLERVIDAAERLGNPHAGFPSVQVAGTNGKGSVANLVAHAACRSGLRTGLFTSPHLHRFAERIRINGVECDSHTLADHLRRVFDLIDKNDLSLTFFEIATLAALSIFAAERVELAVLEVGMGGRLDATSVAAPRLTAVTSIGLDHQAFLGDTLSDIAAEKGGIARASVPLILGRIDGEALTTLQTVASQVGAPIHRLGRDFDLPDAIRPPWPGAHQRDNLSVATELFRQLELLVDSRCTREAFARSLDTAVWPGRFERLPTTPAYILDCAHNPAAMDALVQTLEETKTALDVLLFGALRDKPAAAMLARLRPFAKQVVLAPPPIDRALDPRNLAMPGDTVARDIPAGVAEANRIARPEGVVLTTGSVFTVGAVRGILLGEPSDPPIGL